MANNIVTVIPTYNEKENIVELINEIGRLGMPADILVVDDGSPDGTGQVVESLKIAKPNISVIHRSKKEGLGPAYIEGFRHALNTGKYDYIVQMDADFSHNPKDIPRLLETAAQYDVAIGSRYIKDGGVSDRWNVLRKLISKGGNTYARFVMSLGSRDCTGGFRCYRSKVLESINFKKPFLNGYGFQIQLLYEIRKGNFLTCEVPIFFDERRGGISKMNLQIIIEAFFSLTTLRLKELFHRK